MTLFQILTLLYTFGMIAFMIRFVHKAPMYFHIQKSWAFATCMTLLWPVSLLVAQFWRVEVVEEGEDEDE